MLTRRSFLGVVGGAAPMLLAQGRPREAGIQQEAQASDLRPFPLAPRALVAAEVSARRIVLAWREPAHHEDVAGYVVYRDFEQRAELPATSRTFTDEEIQPGRVYTYAVRARNQAGRESVASGLYGYSGFHPTPAGGGHITLHYAPALPFMTGAAISVFWKDIEREEEGVGDWRYLDEAFERCAAARKRVILWSYLGGEAWTPEWLKPRVRMLDLPDVGRAVYFLDPELMRAWEGFIGRLAHRYGNHPALEQVLLTCAGSYALTPPGGVGDKGEASLAWLKDNCGYREEDHIAAWERSVDLYARLFPHKALAYAVMHLNRTGGPAIEVGERALRKYGSRVRLQTENLNGNPWWRTQPYTWGFSHINHWIARQSARTSVGWQMLGASWEEGVGRDGMDRGRNGPLETALQNGIAFDGSWIEVWKQDLTRAEYHPILRRAAQALGVTTVETPGAP